MRVPGVAAVVGGLAEAMDELGGPMLLVAALDGDVADHRQLLGEVGDLVEIVVRDVDDVVDRDLAR